MLELTLRSCRIHIKNVYLLFISDVCGKISQGNPVQSYALADGNCRTYMKCNSEEGYDDPYCCRRDYTYNVSTATCERLMNYDDRCSYESCPIGYREGKTYIKQFVEEILET